MFNKKVKKLQERLECVINDESRTSNENSRLRQEVNELKDNITRLARYIQFKEEPIKEVYDGIYITGGNRIELDHVLCRGGIVNLIKDLGEWAVSENNLLKDNSEEYKKNIDKIVKIINSNELSVDMCLEDVKLRYEK